LIVVVANFSLPEKVRVADLISPDIAGTDFLNKYLANFS
jgi:hypothetical protein